MTKVLLTIICFLFFANDVLSQGSQIPAVRIYTNNKDKNDPSSFYLPLQYIDSIVHYNIVAPTLITGSAQSITRNSAYFSAKVTSDGGGTISQTGFCWSTNEEPTINSAVKYSEDFKGDNFSVGLLGLIKNTKYYVRSFAINDVGISYGNQVEFTTVNSSEVVIMDGVEYNVVTVGGDCFNKGPSIVIQENLKVTKYANGDTIRYVKNQNELIDAIIKQEGAYCYYNFDPINDSIYGKLYNKFAAFDKRGLAPLGWKILDDRINFGPYDCGGSMKSIGTIESKDGIWKQPNTGATNESGFYGLPSGVVVNNEFRMLGEVGYWWVNDYGQFLALSNNSTRRFNKSIDNEFFPNFGFGYGQVTFASVRCIQD